MILLLLTSVVITHAQQMSIPVTDSLAPPPTAQQSSSEEEEFIQPTRPGIANPAEFQKPGVLQLEYGYDANFRADDFHTQQTAPLTLRFAASKRLLLDFNLDAPISETDEMGMRLTGVGDTRLGFQVLALEDAEQHPALAFAYYIKLPSASREKELGTGRIDHRIVALVSKKMGETDIDFNVAYLNVGREDSGRRASGGQAALSFSRKFENHFGFVAEVAGQSVDDVQPRGIFALGALTYKVNRRLQFDAGMRFGLNVEAPRLGVFTGLTLGVADFFKNDR
jgi:hypothetical protein